jgi:AraC-like DNA-binding protein
VQSLAIQDGPKNVGKPASERDFWAAAGVGWQQLGGDFHRAGFSIEWHDWHTEHALDWAESFHPESIEICLNLEGAGWVGRGTLRREFGSGTAGFYTTTGELAAERAGGQRHRFLSVEFSLPYLKRHLKSPSGSLHPLVRGSISSQQEAELSLSEVTRMNTRHLELLGSLLEPPVAPCARGLWYEGKALELAAEFFFSSEPESRPGTRAGRLAEERVRRVVAILSENLAEPPSLERLGQMVACSPFYLSRTFSNQTGLTISQWLRRARLERAAALLSGGKCNVTEAALEVGYSSLSHFSQAFHEMFGCCPGLYPLKTPAQSQAGRLSGHRLAGGGNSPAR